MASQVERASQRAYEVFLRKQVLGCSQAVMLGIQETFGPRDPLLLKAVESIGRQSRRVPVRSPTGGLSPWACISAPEDKMGDLEALVNPSSQPRDFGSPIDSAAVFAEITRTDFDVPQQRQAWLTGAAGKSAPAW